LSEPRGVRLWVSGRVQGVGFRWFTRRAARRQGLVGRVRNLPDGRVEIEAAGDPESLGQLEREVRQGPSGSSVGRVEKAEIPVDPAWDEFEIDG
jgi:acylphosphatase